MPYNQANSTTYVGFWPVKTPNGDGGMHVGQYSISSGAVPIYAGDPLFLTSVGTVSPGTTVGNVTSGTNVTTVMIGWVGVAAQYVATTTVSGTCLVYDDPNQVFGITASTSAASGRIFEMIGQSVNFLASGVIGSTGGNSLTGRSNVALSGASFNAGWQLTSGAAAVAASSYSFLKCVGVHPRELVNPLTSTATPWSTAAGGTPAFLVTFNTPLFGQLASPPQLRTT